MERDDFPVAVIPHPYARGVRPYRTLQAHYDRITGRNALKREGLELNDGKLHVLYYAADLGGCGYYRAFTPAEVLRDSSRVAAYATPILTGELAHWAHIIVFQRTAGEGSIKAAEELRGHATFVFDLDDDLFSIPYWNPAAAGMKTSAYQARLLAILRMSSHITTTNDALGRKLASKHPVPYTVIPNCVIASRFTPRANTTKTLRIGWAGSSTHYRDLAHALPAIARLQRERDLTFDDRVVFVVMGWKGDTDAGNIFDQAGVCVEYHPFVQPHKYPDALAALRLDIALAPLEPCTFNESKSPIKWEEYSALGVPTVASPVGPYRAIIHGETGLLAAHAQDYYRKLLRLADDSVLRRTIGAQARVHVEYEYGAETTRGRLEELFLSLPIPQTA